MTYKALLFLGLPIDSKLKEVLDNADQKVIDIFVQSSNGSYLREVIYQDIRYLGKFAGMMSDFEHLLLLEANIYSLLKRIIPMPLLEDIPMHLFSIENHSS